MLTHLTFPFDFDNTDKYFLDWVTITVPVPYHQGFSDSYRIADALIDEVFNDWNRFIYEGRISYPHYHGLNLAYSKSTKAHKMLSFQFQGKFWANCLLHDPHFANSTICLKDDIIPVIKAWKKIESWLENIFLNVFDKPTKIFPKVSRIDIARQSKSSLQEATPISKSPENNFWSPMITEGSHEITAFLLGKAHPDGGIDRSSNCHFKVYNKNWDMREERKHTCLTRFGSTNLIRKEWELKRPFFCPNSSHKIDTIYDLQNTFNNKEKLLNLIKAFRKNKDCILYNDKSKYISFHDLKVRKTLSSPSLPHYKLNKIFQKRILRTNKKVPKKNVLKAQYWNPYNQLNGIINKYLHRLSKLELKNIKEKIDLFYERSNQFKCID